MFYSAYNNDYNDDEEKKESFIEKLVETIIHDVSPALVYVYYGISDRRDTKNKINFHNTTRKPATLSATLFLFLFIFYPISHIIADLSYDPGYSGIISSNYAWLKVRYRSFKFVLDPRLRIVQYL
jgi:hypothetical protein